MPLGIVLFSSMGEKFKLVTLLGLLAALVISSESANILGVFTSTSPSHLIVHMSYVKELIERGHNVTVITSIPLKDKNPRYHHIMIPQTEERKKQLAEMKSQIAEQQGILQTIRNGVGNVLSFGPVQADPLKDQRFQNFMNNPGNKFDLVMVGYFFNDFHIGVGVHFKCPIVLSYMSAPNSFLNAFVGNPAEIAYVPVSPLFGSPDLSTFKGRLKNFMINIPVTILTTVMDMQMGGIYGELFPPSDYPSYAEARKKVSLLLLNYHFTDGMIRPNVPAAIECGGIQIKEKPDPLPVNLQKIFNASSEHGVIYVSFGSNLGINDVNPKVFQTIFKSLAGMKQTVLWKWGDLEKPGTSSNIHFEKWLPQDDLLTHPNLKLFITHAGKGSVTESEHHGVPMVAVPIVADQIGNAAEVEKAGFGIQVDQKTMTVDTFKAAVLDVLENPKYKENIQRFSTLTKDRPMTPKETAIFWIEYVIRHKGAYHMQSPAVHLNALQLMSADVIGFLLLVVYVVYKLITIPMKFILRKILAVKCSKKQKVKKQ